MASLDVGEVQEQLIAKRDELLARLNRVSLNLRRPLDPDSRERAKEVADHDVVDALGNEAREEIEQVDAALARLSSGTYGICVECHNEIRKERLAARPYASTCIDCALHNANDGIRAKQYLD